ncbi:class I SAM-dependent DNA methyltransferase [Brucella intermedia]|uniref:class I SAM-dependent DNA methyltransferase n=1 Tax=Brucella intermedia TaxID=94625 RepID=UPI002447CB9B|nr:DNA methyltransferase [Brucella intermedia]WGG59355.1 lactate dehydrogenase [Brucella intermedia]
MNPVEIEEAVSNLALEPFDQAEFPFQFLRAFGQKDTALARLRAGNTNQSDVPGAILQRGNIHIATCDPGAVDETLRALRESPKTTSQKAKFILATDGEAFQAEDMNGGGTVACAYSEFPDHFGFFLPLAGITTVEQIRESSFDIKATGRLNKLYVELLKDNPDWASRSTDMNHFMARLIFCFFAEDTDIFLGEGLFSKTIEQMSARDSSDTHLVMAEIFRAMDTKPETRQAAGIKPYARKFPYVNGQLFSVSTECPRFSKIARSYLLHISSLNWKKINPDIFGSMIQAVADDEERGALGMHYTSVPNILKVLNPLFLDDLREKLEDAGDNSRKLLNLRNRMAKIRVFDPACGSGNFLVIAYKEMRAIEAEINRRRGERDRRSDIPLTNFRGIELRDFPAEIARLALIIAEYQCDVLYRGQQEALAEFLPLDSQNWITCGNALRLDWLSICPPTGTRVKVRGDDLFETPRDQPEIDFENAGGETYICGNPPYLGAKKKSEEQKADMDTVGMPQSIDYVTAFISKAVEYSRHAESDIALVSTSSICQGEQVADFWPSILRECRISFAYRPFRWANSAANNAGVYCTVVGLDRSASKKARLFDGETEKLCDQISPYLIEGPPVVCEPSRAPLSGVAKMVMGSNPVDGRRLIFDKEEAERMIDVDPRAAKFIKKYYGTKELVHGTPRYCLWIGDDEVEVARSIPLIAERLDDCAAYRRTAGRDAKKTAHRPHAFCYTTYRPEPHINVGKVIGEKFEFVPADLKEAGSVTSVDALCIYGSGLIELAVVTSKLHMTWAEAVSGKMGNGIRYGATVVYNTFPLPKLTEQNKADLTVCAENILLAREAHFPATIADLYDPEAMPENLRRAHEDNDEVLERIYIGRRFRNDTERLEKLFEMYTKMTGRGKAA